MFLNERVCTLFIYQKKKSSASQCKIGIRSKGLQVKRSTSQKVPKSKILQLKRSPSQRATSQKVPSRKVYRNLSLKGKKESRRGEDIYYFWFHNNM